MVLEYLPTKLGHFLRVNVGVHIPTRTMVRIWLSQCCGDIAIILGAVGDELFFDMQIFFTQVRT